MITATHKGADTIYLFIAELNGFKAGTVDAKLEFGKQCYLDSTLHELDYRKENDRKDAHENIWLQRLYDDLDKFYDLYDKPQVAHIFKQRVLEGKSSFSNFAKRAIDNHQWTVPVELDASASMLQYLGALLGDERLLAMTNCHGDTLSDPWAFNGIPRKQFKEAATPLLYGSSKACYELWADRGHDFTFEQVQMFNEELANGPLGLANAFKEFLISNVKPKEAMRVRVWDEEFEIECNRFRNVGEETILYDIYDTQTDAIRRLHHTRTKRVADLDQFRRYFVTLLIHNLDSQVGNKVIGKVMEKYGWGIDIHDAFIVNPEAAADVRAWYADELTSIYANRKAILSNYFASVGIGAEAQQSWEHVTSLVKPVASFACGRMALK